MARARKPIFRDSARATTPRITGQRRIRLRFAHETSGSELTSISPSGVRTATAQVETPRIITPSSTACPPTGASLRATGIPSGIRASERAGRPSIAAASSVVWVDSSRLVTATFIGIASGSPSPLTPQRSIHARDLPLAAGGATLEALDPATRVDQLLLARVEGVARGADLDVQLRLRRAGI